MTAEQPEYLFVTGKLAADALRTTLERMDPDFDYRVGERVMVAWVKGWEVVLPDEG